MSFEIGPYRIDPPVALAPMAGVTDLAFRRLCRRSGAGLVVSEMTTSDPSLWHTEKSRLRRIHDPEASPISVQIAGHDPQVMAEAARFNVEQGAQIIDINMGCPAKKVCRVDAGSALLRDEPLVRRILEAVASAVSVPVTLKMRTGWSPEQRNAVRVAQIAQDAGIAALAIHGRTRSELYTGDAEYHTIAAVRRAVRIPILANGDIDSGAKARAVIDQTGVDGVMIGRAALGRPWLLRSIAAELQGRPAPPEPDRRRIGQILLEHVGELHALYGTPRGVRVARKHIQWYCRSHDGANGFWQQVREVDCAVRQLELVQSFFMDADMRDAA